MVLILPLTSSLFSRFLATVLRAPTLIRSIITFRFFQVIILLILIFSHQCYLVAFHWSRRDSKFPHVSRTLPNIPADLNNAVVWMVQILTLIFCFSSLFSLGTVQSVLETTGTTIIFMFHSFFSSLARSEYLSFHVLLFSFCGRQK